MEDEEDMTPFWDQPSSRRHNLRRRSSSLLLNSGVLLIILLVVAAAFIFIIIPSFLSFTSQIFRPHLVKKSWDTLNLVLVLFAIVCGFLSRNSNNNDDDYKFSDRVASSSQDVQKSNPETPQRSWYDNGFSADVKVHNGLSRLRSFSSHPDLRQEEASWVGSNDRWRFYDDTHLYNHRYWSSDDQQQVHQWRPQQKLEVEKEEQKQEQEEEEQERDVVDDDQVKNIGVDTTSVVELQKEVVHTPPPPPESPPPPPSPPPVPPPPQVVRRRAVRRTYEDVANKDHRKRQENTRKTNDLDMVKSTSQPPPRAPPAPPPPPTLFEESSTNERKRGGTSATKEFLTSFRRNNKKKKQRQKSVENLDSFFNYESSYALPSVSPPSPPPPPPPPPPPLPQPPFFHNLFSSKKRKAKKIHSVPPPPPPPPPRTQNLSASASASKVESKNVPYATQKPPLPVKIKTYTTVEETVNSGNESPLMNVIPPPPPLPPFKMPAWKFEVHGDFVRLKSNNYIDDPEESSSPSDAGDLTMSPLFCPSPDVDTKADNFIATFRAGLRLEKMNSVKEKEAGRGRSNLGPEPGPS